MVAIGGFLGLGNHDGDKIVYLERLAYIVFAITTTPASVFASHHLCQILESVPPLVDNFMESVCRPNGSNDDLIASRCKTFEYFVHECMHWHAELSTSGGVHVVM